MIKQRGFTLLELLVVIGIIGILLTLITVSFSSAQKGGRDSRRRQDLVSIQNAMEQYYSQNSFNYPVAANCSTANYCSALSTYFSGGLPKDPITPTTDYVYSDITASSYTVTATLEKGGTISVSNLQ